MTDEQTQQAPVPGSSGYYSTKDLTDRYSIKPRTLYDWKKRDGFPTAVLFGRYCKDQVHEWEQRMRRVA